MGAGSSSSRYIEGSDKFIASVVMPLYYVPNAKLTELDTKLLTRTWRQITESTSEEFQRKDKEGGDAFAYTSCLTWFSAVFTARFFDIHHLSAQMFTGGLDRCIVGVLSVLIASMGEEKKFQEVLAGLSQSHNARGVKLMEYGVIGDVLFWTVKHCIGAIAYTPEVELAWIKFYSMILSVIIPLAVAAGRQVSPGSQDRVRLGSDGRGTEGMPRQKFISDDMSNLYREDEFERSSAQGLSRPPGDRASKLSLIGTQRSGEYIMRLGYRPLSGAITPTGKCDSPAMKLFGTTSTTGASSSGDEEPPYNAAL